MPSQSEIQESITVDLNDQLHLHAAKVDGGALGFALRSPHLAGRWA